MELTNRTVSRALGSGRRALVLSYLNSRGGSWIRRNGWPLFTRLGSETQAALRSVVVRKFSSRTPANGREQQERKNSRTPCRTIEEELSLSADHGSKIWC